MNKYFWFPLFVAGGLVLVGMFGALCHNAVIQADNAVEGRMGDLQSQYQRRNDLLPNLVRTVEAAAGHELRLQRAVTQLRSAQGVAEQSSLGTSDASRRAYDNAQQRLGLAIHAVVEAYPQVTATANFRDLQAQIEGTENRIAVARRDYNGAVQDYNNTIESLPTSLFADGRRHRSMFQAAPGVEPAPVLRFHDGNNAQ